jgi:hypothetical protein
MQNTRNIKHIVPNLVFANPKQFEP